MQFLRTDADFSAHSKLKAIRKSCRDIGINDSSIHPVQIGCDLFFRFADDVSSAIQMLAS